MGYIVDPTFASYVMRVIGESTACGLATTTTTTTPPATPAK